MNNNVLKKKNEIKGTGTKSATVILDIIMVNPSTWLLLYLNTKIFCNISGIRNRQGQGNREDNSKTKTASLYQKVLQHQRGIRNRQGDREDNSNTKTASLYPNILQHQRGIRNRQGDREDNSNTKTACRAYHLWVDVVQVPREGLATQSAT